MSDTTPTPEGSFVAIHGLPSGEFPAVFPSGRSSPVAEKKDTDGKPEEAASAGSATDTTASAPSKLEKPSHLSEVPVSAVRPSVSKKKKESKLIKKSVDVTAAPLETAAPALASPSLKETSFAASSDSGKAEGIELQKLQASETKEEKSGEQKDGRTLVAVSLDGTPSAEGASSEKGEKALASRAESDSDVDLEDIDEDDDDKPKDPNKHHDPNQSPIPEVAACIPNTDDPDVPVWTFRLFVLGIILTIFMAFINQFFWYRTTPFQVGILVVQVVAFPLGKAMAKYLPARKYRVPGLTLGRFEIFPEWEFTMNAGPFNLKEHALITMMANTAFNTAYAVDIITIQKLPVYYNNDQGFLYGLLLVLTTQFVGYGMAGALRKYLVWPASMVWPSNLVNCTLFFTLHKPEERDGRIGRYTFFCIVACCSFAYYWFPGYIFPVLTSLSFLCWAGGGYANGGSQIAAQLGSGTAGLGLGAIALDWNQITSFLGSPLVSPWWATANILFGFVLFVWIIVPILYYNNVFNAKLYPIYNPFLYDAHGQWFHPTSIMTNHQFDEAKYEALGPVRMTMFFAITYGITFAGIAAVITHTALYHGKRIYRQFKQSRVETPDIHYRLMERYPEVPQWHYITLFVISLVIGMIIVEVYETFLPWYFVFFAVALSGIFVLPIGIIQAVTNQQMGLNVITEFIVGYALPGKPIANVIFKTFGYISMAQALLFSQDLKLGHYMKIPPKAMFWAQVLGTVVACFTNLLTAYWLMATVPGICDTNKDWLCVQARTFFSASAIWGLIGPAKVFGGDSPYSSCLYFFLIGALIPIPFYFLKQRFPNVTVLKYLHWPLIFSAISYLPPAATVEYPTWCLVGFIFQFLMRKYNYRWFKRYNYVTSAGMDTGLAFSAFIIFMAVQYNTPKGDFFWWGKQSLNPNPTVPDFNGDECNLASANYNGLDCVNVGCVVVDGQLMPYTG